MEQFGKIFFKTLEGSIKEYPLKSGKNIVGRDAPSTPADVTIRLQTDDKGISRRHFQIDVRRGLGGMEHHITHLKENNQTILISPTQKRLAVFVGDDIFLRNKYKIVVGNTELKFHFAEAAVPTTNQKH